MIPVGGLVQNDTPVTTILVELLDAVKALVEVDGLSNVTLVSSSGINNENGSSDENKSSFETIMASEVARGFMRTARLELPSRVRVVCIETDATDKCGDGLNIEYHSSALGAQLLAEMVQTDNQVDVAYHDNIRLVRRLQASPDHIPGPVSLYLDKRGAMSNLQVFPQVVSPSLSMTTASTTVPSGMISVHVRAVGLNFKDLLNVLMPDEAAYVGGMVPLPGADFAGTVVALPADFQGDLATGGAVFGMSMVGSGVLHSYATVS